MPDFPADFVWGAAAAAYQIEGAHDLDGKGPSVWDAFCERPGAIWNGDDGRVACDHYRRYAEDVELLAPVLARADVLVSQPIRDGYRDLPLGTAELAALLALLLWPQGLYRAANWLLIRLKRQPIVHQASRGNLIRWSLLQAGAWVCGGLFIFFLAAGLYPDLGWSHMVPVVRSWAASGLVAMVALIVPLGLGLKETAFAYLLAALVPWPVAVSISLLGRFCSIIGDCVGLLLASRL